MSERLSADEARRIALGAQGFARTPASGAPHARTPASGAPHARTPASGARLDRRHARIAFDHVGVIQIDSVNVVARSHELALFARLGDHPRDLLDRLVQAHEVFEYWAHEASFVPVALQPLLRWRMAAAERGATWSGLAQLNHERPGYIEAVYGEIRDRGPLTSSEVTQAGAGTGAWWGWNDAKRALAYLFWCGRVTSRRRLANFERHYDLPERVLPADVLARPTPLVADAQRELLAVACRAHGVGTARDLADYFRLPLATARSRLAELVEGRRVEPVEVEGWNETAYLDPAAGLPKRVQAATLLSPFDSLIWERRRTERVFGFHYRLEIYTPAARRRFGYYVLPFLFGDRLVGRVDVKADRRNRRLLVLGAHGEQHAPVGAVAGALRDALARLAGWLGLSAVAITANGDLAVALGTAGFDAEDAAATDERDGWAKPTLRGLDQP